MPYPRPTSWRLHTARGLRKYLNPDERRRFLAAADLAAPELRAFCHLLAWTGCRLSEALDVVAGDLDPAGSVAIRSLKKRGRPEVREVPVPDEVLAQLGRLLSPAGRLWPWGRTTAWRYVKAIMAAAGISGPHASPKGLRHGFGVHALRPGVPLNLLQRWLGHADIATTAIYADAMGAEEREIAARMW
ncbi:tyrosine-type recombinase/integrase [Methylobacterium sp. C25]|uniref:tyrosine-type recombinase/integrase n=1 Tax=Methylobacterium sp. C25 TaxID=2721622 RepID=UPI001F1978CC|nr:tyrosine-type recombinase/integrase [Methylobacterium sp. C25]MCE4226349.1 tyrosine-type recombinase/integrase [Methylobacterium sp. C25]